MPKSGFFFDSVIRQKQIIEEELDYKENLEEYKIISDGELSFLKGGVERLYQKTDYAILGSVASSGFGDIAFIPGPMLKNPKGIRDIEEWYVSLYKRKEYVKKVFQGQLEIALENYKKIFEYIGNKINIVAARG